MDLADEDDPMDCSSDNENVQLHAVWGRVTHGFTSQERKKIEKNEDDGRSIKKIENLKRFLDKKDALFEGDTVTVMEGKHKGARAQVRNVVRTKEKDRFVTISLDATGLLLTNVPIQELCLKQKDDKERDRIK